jgi:hypothetical protein
MASGGRRNLPLSMCSSGSNFNQRKIDEIAVL